MLNILISRVFIWRASITYSKIVMTLNIHVQISGAVQFTRNYLYFHHRKAEKTDNPRWEQFLVQCAVVFYWKGGTILNNLNSQICEKAIISMWWLQMVWWFTSYTLHLYHLFFFLNLLIFFLLLFDFLWRVHWWSVVGWCRPA